MKIVRLLELVAIDALKLNIFDKKLQIQIKRIQVRKHMRLRIRGPKILTGAIIATRL